MYFRNLDILVAIDPAAPSSLRALRAAAALAEDGRGRLTLLSVSPTPLGLPAPLEDTADLADREAMEEGLLEMTQTRLEALAQQEIPGRGGVIEAALGKPSQAILARAGRGANRLVVMGAGEGRALGRLVLGSTTERVLRKCPVPVLVAGWEQPRLAGATEVLVALDFSEPSLRALRASISLVRVHGGRLTLLAVDAGPALLPSDTGWPASLREQVRALTSGRREALEARLLEVVRDELPDDVRFEASVAAGRPAEVLLKKLEGGGFDLVAMGATGPSGHAPGTVTRRLVRRCPVPALVCP